jgi:DNA-binding XRE family transcriptional regulator
MASSEGNRKISKNRGKQWKENLVAGRIDAELHPTKLKLARLKKLLSQGKVAEILGISLATYGAVERGKRAISKKNLVQLMNIFKVPVKELFSQAEDKFMALK